MALQAKATSKTTALKLPLASGKRRRWSIKNCVKVVEVRGLSAAWITHPTRMLRHKAMVQCARLAFGLTGVFDADELAPMEDLLQLGAEGQNRNPNWRSYDSRGKKRFPTGTSEIKQSLMNVV